MIFSWGVGTGAGGIWLLFKFKDLRSFIYGAVIFVGSLLAASLIRMFADMGQLMFDLRVDIGSARKDANELDQRLNQELINQLQAQADSLNRDLRALTDKLGDTSLQANELDQRLNQELRNQLQAQADSLNRDLRALTDKLGDTSLQANELDQRLNQELRNQLQAQANALNQELKNHFHLHANSLNQELKAIRDRLERAFTRTSELEKLVESFKNIFMQMNSESKDASQNIRQIKTFFERIEKHLDLKK
jgi:chromosome segregation ATPase